MDNSNIKVGFSSQFEPMVFFQDYNSKRSKPDYTVGIFQSIGFKEFHEVIFFLNGSLKGSFWQLFLT